MKPVNGIILVVVLSCSCYSCKYDSDCCKQYEPQSDESTYCNKHRSAAYEFVQNEDGSLSSERLQLLRSLFEEVSGCSDVGCIERSIDQDTLLILLKQSYSELHAVAESHTNLQSQRKHELILCGFANAIGDIEAIMKSEGQ